MLFPFNQSRPNSSKSFDKQGLKRVNTSRIRANYTRYWSKPTTLDLPVGKNQIFSSDYPLEFSVIDLFVRTTHISCQHRR